MPYTAQKIIKHCLETGINTKNFYCVTVDGDDVNVNVNTMKIS